MPSIKERLFEKQDLAYRDLQSKLVPHIEKDTIIGVRTPYVRQIAKEIYGKPEADVLLNTLPHDYYEENLLHFFLIALCKDFAKCIQMVEIFLPYVDCWPVSDQVSPKVFKKHHEELLPYIKKWIDSEHVYTARFGIRMLMNEFLDEDFHKEYLELVAAKEGEDYYLKMMIAWYFSTALAKQYEAAVVYVEQRRLPEWIHKKTIQKAVESFRVTDEHKRYLKSFR